MRRILCFLVITLVISCKGTNSIYLGANSCCKSVLQYFSVSDEKVLEFIREKKKLIILESTSGESKGNQPGALISILNGWRNDLNLAKRLNHSPPSPKPWDNYLSFQDQNLSLIHI